GAADGQGAVAVEPGNCAGRGGGASAAADHAAIAQGQDLAEVGRWPGNIGVLVPGAVPRIRVVGHRALHRSKTERGHASVGGVEKVVADFAVDAAGAVVAAAAAQQLTQEDVALTRRGAVALKVVALQYHVVPRPL